tara:strand:- start:211 stop:369 length:159 start_codon:yes stop_codon:yes gene_type:complete
MLRDHLWSEAIEQDVVGNLESAESAVPDSYEIGSIFPNIGHDPYNHLKFSLA